MLLIIRLSNGMEKCEQAEELLVKVLSSSSHHKGITGPVHAASTFRTMEVLYDEYGGAQIHAPEESCLQEIKTKGKSRARMCMAWPLPTFTLSTVQ